MKFLKGLFKKKKEANDSKIDDLSNQSGNPAENIISKEDRMEFPAFDILNDSILTLAEGEEPTDEQLESLFRIDKELSYSEKVPLMFETYSLGFDPPVNLEIVKLKVGKINQEYHDDFSIKYINFHSVKVFIETANYSTGEVIETIRMQGSPDLIIGQGAYAFSRKYFFQLALEITSIEQFTTIFRDDLGYQRVEFTRDDLKRYISSH